MKKILKSKEEKNIFSIIIIIIVGCIVMAIVDRFIRPVYFIKSLIKFIFFLIIPIIYFKVTKNKDFKEIFKIKKENIGKYLLLGLGVYIFILGSYYITQNFYNFSGVVGVIEKNFRISKDNFVIISLYIAFCNSLLEEIFFRGIGFHMLSKYVSKKYAYLFSASTFAIYHMAIIDGWFSPIIFILIILGLLFAGYIFDYIDDKEENIYNSWMVHMFANFAINTVGFILFGII